MPGSRVLELLALRRADPFIFVHFAMCRREPRESPEILDYFHPPLNQSGAICRVGPAKSAALGKICRDVFVPRQGCAGTILPVCAKSMLSRV
jgi:hypothetical protein